MPEVASPPPPAPARITQDNLAINVVITFLGVFSLLGLSFVFCVLMFHHDQPVGGGLSALIALVGTTVGSLGSILAQTRTAPVPWIAAPTTEPAPGPTGEARAAAEGAERPPVEPSVPLIADDRHMQVPRLSSS